MMLQQAVPTVVAVVTVLSWSSHVKIHTHTHNIYIYMYMRETRSIIDKGRAEKARIVLYGETVERESEKEKRKG